MSITHFTTNIVAITTTFGLNSLQNYKKSAILARKICDFAQKNLRFYIVSAQKVTAGEGFYGLFVFVFGLVLKYQPHR